MNVMRRPVLQLNASYEALRIIPAMRIRVRFGRLGKVGARFNSSMRHLLDYPVRLSSSLPLLRIWGSSAQFWYQCGGHSKGTRSVPRCRPLPAE